MNKLLWRYLVYFGIFITLVQLFEYNGTQELFAKCGFRVDFSPLGTYAPLFLSVLLIDITYRIGKRQNEIAEQQTILQKEQNKVVEQQTRIQKEQYQLDKFNAYKELYRCLFGLKRFSQYILPKIYDYIMSGCSEEDLKGLEEFEGDIEKMRIEFERCEADFDLRVGKELDMKDVLGFIQMTHFLIITAYSLQYNGPLTSMPPKESSRRRVMIRFNYNMDKQVEIIHALAKNTRLKSAIDEFVAEYRLNFEGKNDILAHLKKLYNE